MNNIKKKSIQAVFIIVVIASSTSLGFLLGPFIVRNDDNNDNDEEVIIPTWDNIPNNLTIDYGIPFEYDINASDDGHIEAYLLGNTPYFQIDLETGLLTNNTNPPLGNYELLIFAIDNNGNAIKSIINISI